MIKLVYIFTLFSFLGCKKKDEQNKTEFNNQDIFKSNVIIILKNELVNDSKIIDIQDYIENGKSFVPIFTNIDKFKESTKGTIDNSIIEINGIFLISLLNGNETLRLNPGLDDEEYFDAKTLIEKYSNEIEKLNEEMKNSSKN